MTPVLGARHSIRWRSLISLRSSEVRLLLEAAIFLVGYEIGFAPLSSKSWLRALTVCPGDAEDGPRLVSHRVAWAVEVADRSLPSSSCLRRAVVLAHMLQRRGFACRLRFGVARRRDELIAHAWVEHRGQAVPGQSSTLDYAPLVPWTPQWPPGAR